jgi:L-malate glycosyltransferase
MTSKPRLMLIGHTYGLEVNREKALHLATHFDVRVCTCDLEGWKVLGREVTDTHSPGHESAYNLKRLRRWPRWQDYTKIAFRGLQAEIADFRPDIVLVENEPWSWLRWQARWSSWRVVPKAKFAEFTWENVERSGFKGWVLQRIYQVAAATGGLIICGNQEARRLCIQAGFPEHEAIVAPQLGISIDDHPHATSSEREEWRLNFGWDANATVLGFCGRLVEEKGLLELVEATKLLREKYPNLYLVIVGEGELRKILEAQDSSGNWLKVLPSVPHEAIPSFLNKLDFFILPSKPLKTNDGRVWEEQFGHVLIEAMACGTLTLGSDSGAIPEVLDDPSVTFKHSDVSDLANRIEYWLSDQSLRRAKAEEQREQSSQKWTHEAIAQIYLSILAPQFIS